MSFLKSPWPLWKIFLKKELSIVTQSIVIIFDKLAIYFLSLYHCNHLQWYGYLIVSMVIW